jgi:hypothetical protein
MMDKQPYSYTVLRYVHDIMTGEFVNVGVVVYAPSLSWLRAKTRPSMGRVKELFPDLDRKAFTSAMNAVKRGITKIGKDTASPGLLRPEGDAVTMARMALPADDSSLQWSPAGTGLTNDPENTLERLYGRFVARYDMPHPRRRSDDEIWRPVQQRLKERNLGNVLERKTISGEVDEIVFKHAWRNGEWHVYEPVSFDLADSDGIKSKAREWLGHLSAVVAGKAEAFRPHFIVGAPSNPDLHTAYRSALTILGRAPNDPAIYEEEQIDDLVAHIEDEVRTHRRDF